MSCTSRLLIDFHLHTSYIQGNDHLSRNKASKIFCQSEQTLFQLSSSSMKDTLKEEFEVRLRKREFEDPDCLASAEVVKAAVKVASGHLFFEDQAVRLRCTWKYIGEYKKKLRDIGTKEAKKASKTWELLSISESLC